MKIYPFKLAICRTPAFAAANTLSEVWPQLKEKIRTSSPAFYELIADKTADEISSLNNKVQFTIWKYFNRAKFRATPFGSFAAFGTLLLKDKPMAPALLRSTMVEHQFTDWSEKDVYQEEKDILQHSTLLFSNSTIYEVGDEIRYISFKEGEFQLSSVFSFDELQYILKTCATKTSLNFLYQQLQNLFNMDKKSSKDLINQLIELQLILTDLLPNITGDDYFKRINVAQKDKSIDYILAERQLNGFFDLQKLSPIPELINCLAKLKPCQTSSNLQQFKTAFVKRFEERHIPLSMAMDPELGIGYGNLEQQFNANDLIGILNNAKIDNSLQNKIQFTKLHSFLLNKIIAGETIDLHDFKTPAHPSPLPNTFSLIFHLYKGNVVVENIGGCTANSLLGRFTLASKPLETYAKEIAAIEQEANPGVICFDIAYQAEKKIDNVNRRKNIYPQELPILSWSAVEDPLTLADIMIGVQGNEIILSSKKLGKRLIPRIASAYNYCRSDLAVYRFLCDLQHQGIQSSLQFNLNEYFPCINYYPRVYFKQVIVAPAQWLVPASCLQQKEGETLAQTISKLKEWLHEQHISAPFKAGNGDLTLTFNPQQPDDLMALINYAKQQHTNDLYITEALIAAEDLLMDEQGKGYHPQFIVNYYHQEQRYQPLGAQQSQNPWQHRAESEVELPGGEWLYFEIYCHPFRSNFLLLNEIAHFLRQHQSLLKSWFFIRYDTPAPHIRLRLHVKEQKFTHLLMQSLKQLLAPLLLTEIISDIQLKTYYRETKRYGAHRMALVEYFFYQDSKLVLEILKKAKTTAQLYHYGLEVMQLFCQSYTNDLQQQMSFVKRMANCFAEEMEMNIEIFKKLNSNFTAFKNKPESLKPFNKHLAMGRQKALAKVLQLCPTIAEQENLLADLIHMHINRLFDADQRKHETILYHYLLKILQTKRALVK